MAKPNSGPAGYLIESNIEPMLCIRNSIKVRRLGISSPRGSRVESLLSLYVVNYPIHIFGINMSRQSMVKDKRRSVVRRSSYTLSADIIVVKVASIALPAVGRIF